MAWEWRENNREKVLESLRKGEYEAILTSREGVSDELVLRTLAILPFVEAMNLSAAANTLFEDAAVLLQLGYSPSQK